MHVLTSPVTVLAYNSWGKAEDADPPKWKSGQLVEYVVVMDPENPEAVRQITLDESINGSRSPVGSVVELACLLTPNPATVTGQSGRTRTIPRDKWKCVEMRPVAPDAKATAKQ